MELPLSRRLTRCPIPFDRAAGADVRAVFADMDAETADLLDGTAGCSPYLRDLMQRHAEWLRDTVQRPPEDVLADELAALASVAPDALGLALRQAKGRIALLVALADLGGVWALEQVTGALTALSDRAVDLCVKTLVADELRRGKLPGQGPDAADTAAGMVVLAMGKTGAHELNYSSDIDLICLFDETRYGDDWQDARTAFIRVTRKMTALLSDVSAGGYVFRTDLRLRPDAAVTPVCISMAAAEGYYESVGRTWERAAFIKARPCAGDIAAGARFLKTLVPFVWRKHLDFAAIQDAHDMRLRIREHRGLNGPIVLEGHNLKLGAGGIREIEFFTQTRQLIAGGRDASLRDRTTVGGLEALAAKGWVPGDVAQTLTADYRAHREVEHRLQMVADAQTHDLPATPDGIARIAAFCGHDAATFRADLVARLERVDGLTEGFFAPGAAQGAVPDGPELSDKARAIVAGWKGYPALRSERAVTIFHRLRPRLLQALMRAANPDEALVAFDGFLVRLPAGVQIFSLFEANPSLVGLISDIAGTAPNLAHYLARNASVLDAVIGGSFFSTWPGVGGLTQMLGRAMAAEADYERKLDAARSWQKDWHFRIGVHHLRGLIGAEEAGQHYADLAEAVVAAVWPAVCHDMTRRHGPPPGQGAVVLGMGSLGAGRLNSGSDLDLIVIYDADGVEESAGPRVLATRPYYARLTQALVTALSAQMAEGRLYEVDMRLRPSGRQGPVATALGSFRTYQETEAWTWEHLALTRARALAGDATLGAEVEAFRQGLLAAKGQGASVMADVADMRARLAAAKPADGAWEAKNGPGRLMDIELLAEAAALRSGSPARRVSAQIAGGAKRGFLSQSEAQVLTRAYRLCWQVQASARLLTDTALDLDDVGEGGVGEGGRAFVLREAEAPDVSGLAQRMADVTDEAAAVIDAVLKRESADGSDQGGPKGAGARKLPD